MVKFQKQLEAELVPEWRAAYCKYKHLKKDLKRIRRASTSINPAHHGRLSESSVFSLSALTRRMTTIHAAGKDAIAVRHRFTSSSEDVYETELLEENLANDHNVKAFFKRLDAEFNKVNRFYKSQEEEFIQRAQQLDKQINTLLQLKKLVQEQRVRRETSNSVIHPGQAALVQPVLEKLDDDHAAQVLEKKDLESLARQNLGLDNSVQDLSVSDDEKSVEEHRENLLVGSNETNYDTRNESDEDEDLEVGLEALEQEEIFISNEQEFLPDKIQFERLSVLDEASVPLQQRDRNPRDEEIQEIEKHENVENLSTVTVDAIDSSKPEDVVVHMPRGTIISVVEDMENQVEESKFEANKGPPAVNIHMPITTPVATISAISHILWEDILQQMRRTAFETKQRNGIYLSKKKVIYAEKVLYKALVEFYRGLGLLKSYSSLNLLAFAKILKKFDKATDESVAPIYFSTVERSFFASSDTVMQIMARVEKLFTEYFEGKNRRKAMSKLRPMQQKASHRISFWVGVFSGASVALVGVLSIIAPTTLWRYKAGGKTGPVAYYDTVFPIFSLLASSASREESQLPKSEFRPGKVMRYRDIFFLSTSLTCIYLGVMVGHIAGHSTKKQPSVYFDFLPMTVLVIFLLLLFCPFNIIYRSGRVFLLRTTLHVVCAPLYKVVLADFFLADQLTSQVPCFRQFEWVLCYYLGGYYKHGDGTTCSRNIAFQRTIYLVSLLPYWWRAAQCFRRYVDEGGMQHIANCGKYFSALIAMALRVDYSRKSNNKALLAMTIFWSVIATAYQLYWDLVMDWGLLKRRSRNPWLRDSLILREYKYVYYVTMVMNAILRLAWLQSVARWKLGNLDGHMTEFVFSSLEIIRRGVWNFFRIENEHLTNIGKFRAVMHVPLPFEELRTTEEP